MITEIQFGPEASYNSVTKIADLKKVNFFFGANGAGKTTLSKVVAASDAKSGRRLHWLHENKLETFVYNDQYVSENFSQDSVDGIVTLGRGSIEAQKEVARLRDQKARVQEKLASTRLNLANVISSVKAEIDKFNEIVWAQRNRFGSALKLFPKLNGKKEKFIEHFHKERAENQFEELSEDQIKADVLLFFSDENPEELPKIQNFEADYAIAVSDRLHLRPIISAASAPGVAELIKRICADDWVRNGLKFLPEVAGACPFCQENLAPERADALRSYFDDAYEAAVSDFKGQLQEYQKCFEDIKDVLNRASGHKCLDLNAFSVERQKLTEAYADNLASLRRKADQPGLEVGLVDCSEALTNLRTLIIQANDRVSEHNLKISQLEISRQKVQSYAWRFIIAETEDDFRASEIQLEPLRKSQQGLLSAIDQKEKEIEAFDHQIEELHAEETSVLPTVDKINAILKSSGFDSFQLTIADDDPTRYKACRSDGSDARKTLSEGERNFLTFLYFNASLSSVAQDSGVAHDRIVFIDDPVSSLDSNMLFAVSSMVRKLIKEVQDGSGHVRQLFLTTHNAYFHRQASHRCDGSVSFWSVRKGINGSEVLRSEVNPVSTAYELLWAEVRAKSPSPVSLENAMRRILEFYFEFLGQIKLDKLESGFPEDEQVICNSLISWVHAGSHAPFDPLSEHIGPHNVELYQGVFKRIFELNDQGGHYEMMMRGGLKSR